MSLWESFLISAILTFADVPTAQAPPQAHRNQFLDWLAASQKYERDQRTANLAHLESKLKAQQSMHLGCQFVEKSDVHQFEIYFSNITEPEEDMGTSLIWTANANFQGKPPPGLAANEEVSYGGPPEDVGIYFHASELRLERVSWGWAAQYEDGLIKCVVLSGVDFVF